MRRDIRLLVVGDPGVGKSTLVTALIKEVFVAPVQSVVPEVTIPPEITPENVTTHVIDSTDQTDEQRDRLTIEARKAHAIMLVYTLDNLASLTAATTHWLPWLRTLGAIVPVLLVGNKADLRDQAMDHEARATASRLAEPATQSENGTPVTGSAPSGTAALDTFDEIEASVECSARRPATVTEVFYLAQRAVLHPTRPLYDPTTQSLRPACRRALDRVFHLCDHDADGILNDTELNAFQRRCFDVPLHRAELDRVRQVVAAHLPDGIRKGGLTPAGFAYLHQLFIVRGRPETPWAVLRAFGYDHHLALRPDYLLPPFEVPSDCCVELSQRGTQFFNDLFDRGDRDGDGALSDQELDFVFAPAPAHPWVGTGFPALTTTNDAGHLTRRGFLDLWCMTTLLDVNTTLSYLAYLGFDGPDTREGLRVVKRRPATTLLRSTPARTVYRGLVVGAAGVGKTALLGALVDPEDPLARAARLPRDSPCAVGTVPVRGTECHLVLQELTPGTEATILASPRRSRHYDVLCFVYDPQAPASFEYLVRLRERFDLNHLPHVFVATRADLVASGDAPPPRHPRRRRSSAVRDTPTPDAYCCALRIHAPLVVSCAPAATDGLTKSVLPAAVFTRLVAAAMDPESALPGAGRSLVANPSLRRLLRASLLLGALAALGLVSYRYWRLVPSGHNSGRRWLNI
ncbi:ERMES complex Ca(2+)-binding regulatory GTPase gem1 [Tieghemiomyces parasiticus]|uniref:Mitochondrial Rho GTPase n=1 Tax=Tieghemiomyces parasiticus TaxID=78921 RepID=A0A9W8E151_9FUNG|nr:ERMES complex Ca(2+)-binding regulatory GTPase gem1 [Tieghemiomyces parasiticus]